MTAAVTARLRARRTGGGPARTYRLANSIRLPFGIGITALLLLALGTGLLVGRVTDQDLEVPGAVRDLQASLTTEVAESTRRGLNEGVDDVEQLAREVDGVPDPAGALRSFAAIHGRYQSVFLLERGRAISSLVGSPPRLDLLADDAVDGPGMRVVIRPDVVFIAQVAPLEDGSGRLVVAQYDPQFLRFAMGVAAPGDAWVVDEKGRVVTGLSDAAPATRLQRIGLDAAARRASAGRDGVAITVGGPASRDVVAWRPVSGVGPAGQLGWGVVTARRVDSAGLGATGARRQAIAIGLALALTTLIAFAWLRAVVVRPMLDLQRDAERLAYGDLKIPVAVRRYDEIGMIARSLERIRVLLIRHQMRSR